MRKFLIIIVVLLLVIVVINRIYENQRSADLMKNTTNTYATITSVGGGKGTCYINYFYFVEGIKYEGSELIAGTYCNDEHIGIQDLEIIYAVEDHELSDVVDERFRW